MQGGSVISHLLRSDRPYQLRAITRDVSKPAAKKLESQGVQLVQADTEKSSDLDRAFEGANIVFVGRLALYAGCGGLLLTRGFHLLRRALPTSGRTCPLTRRSQTASESSMQSRRPVSSSLCGAVSSTSQRFQRARLQALSILIRRHVHYHSRPLPYSVLLCPTLSYSVLPRSYLVTALQGLITAYANELDVPLLIVSPGCYMSNFASPYFNMAPRKLDDGSVVLSLPVPGSTVVSLLDTEADYGAYVREALEAPQFDGKAGQEVLASSDEKTLEQMVQEFNEGVFFIATRLVLLWAGAARLNKVWPLPSLVQSLAPTPATSMSRRRTGSHALGSRARRRVSSLPRCCAGLQSTAVCSHLHCHTSVGCDLGS